MPPIFGILNTDLQPVALESIGCMTGAATYIKPRNILKWTKQGCLMAAAVIDAGGKEAAASGQWVCIADASLYKFDTNVETHGRASQQILQTWLNWKEDCVKHLYGDFAFVIFNTGTGEIFCGRDHMGVRPLFYAYTGNTFIFASELRLVVAAMPEKPQVRQDYLFDTLVTKKTEKGLTPFADIYRLKPAHFLNISNGRFISGEYWRLDPAKKIRLNSESDYITLLREKLVNAVEARCRGAGIGTELSGGLDSSAVTGIAARLPEKEGKVLPAYSNVFPQGTDMDYKDEREFIGEMAGFTSLRWTGIDRLSMDIPALLQHAIRVQGCYIQQNFSILSDALYEAAGRDNIRVLLSGFGGDEMASSRTSVQWNELIGERQWQVIKEELFHKGITIKSLAKAGVVTLRYLVSPLKKTGHTSGVFTKELLDGRFANIPLQPDFANEHQLRQRLADQYIREKRDSLSMKQFDRIMHDHVPQRMEYCYAAAAQYGIEYRYALLDADLLETFMAFPPWLKQHQGINRYAFRQAIQGFVPEAIRKRNDKSGATIPQTFYSFANEGEKILEAVRKASGSPFLNTVFDFSKFPCWYECLVKRDPKDMNYLMPGAFYTYLMILLYYMDKR